MRIDPSQVRRLLVIKLRAVGDIVLSTIVTRNLRLAFPDARIDYLVEAPYVDTVTGNPFVDTVIIYDRRTMNGIDLIRSVRRESYDLIIDLFGNPRTAVLTRLSGAPHRVGFRFRNRTYAYNIVAEPRGGEVHNTQFNLDALAALGVDIQDRNIYFHITPEGDTYIDEWLRSQSLEGKFLVGVNPGGGWYTKRWGADRFASLCDLIVERYGVEVIILWGPGEAGLVEDIRKLMRHTPRVPPRTTLKQLGALLKRCRFLVSNDSGPMHIATAVGTAVLGIYGPTNPRLQGPYGEGHLVIRNEGLDCLGCNLVKCPIGHPCMLDLKVNTVLEAVDQFIRKNNLII